jgi:hypothetical protein
MKELELMKYSCGLFYFSLSFTLELPHDTCYPFFFMLFESIQTKLHSDGQFVRLNWDLRL